MALALIARGAESAPVWRHDSMAKVVLNLTCNRTSPRIGRGLELEKASRRCSDRGERSSGPLRCESLRRSVVVRSSNAIAWRRCGFKRLSQERIAKVIGRGSSTASRALRPPHRWCLSCCGGTTCRCASPHGTAAAAKNGPTGDQRAHARRPGARRGVGPNLRSREPAAGRSAGDTPTRSLWTRPRVAAINRPWFTERYQRTTPRSAQRTTQTAQRARQEQK